MNRTSQKRKPEPSGGPADATHGAIEFTEKFRRGASVLFPLAVLLHLLFTYGAWPALVRPSLALAVALALVGYGFRYVRRASVVLAAGGAYAWIFLVYTIGIAPSVGYLVLSDRRSWLPWAPLTSVALFLGFLAYRVRLDLARDWSHPLDETPGIVVNRADGTLWREYGKSRQGGLTRGAVVVAAVLAPLVYFSYGTPMYLIVVFVIAGHCVAWLTTGVVAWWVAYCIAVLRWERANELQLRLPSLHSRKATG